MTDKDQIQAAIEALETALETDEYNAREYQNSPVNIKGFLLKRLNKKTFHEALTSLRALQERQEKQDTPETKICETTGYTVRAR